MMADLLIRTVRFHTPCNELFSTDVFTVYCIPWNRVKEACAKEKNEPAQTARAFQVPLVEAPIARSSPSVYAISHGFHKVSHHL